MPEVLKMLGGGGDTFNDQEKEDLKECFQMLNAGGEEVSEEDITLSVCAIEGKQGV